MKNKISVLSILLMTTLLCYSQQIKWKENPGKTYVFRISDKEALKLLKSQPKDSLVLKMLHTPVDSFTDTWQNQPEKGHFIFAYINKNKVGFNYVPVIPFQVFLFKEYGALTIQVLDSAGNVNEKAKVKINNTSIAFDKESRTYTFDDYWSDESLRILTVESDKFKAYFDLNKHAVSSSYRGENYHNSPQFYSYMITDKNKYKPGETVRFKSYALSGGKHPLKDDLELWIRSSESYNNGYQNFRKLTSVSPYHPGGFAGEFQLHDSLNLTLDKTFPIQLRDNKGRIVASTSINYEDYELYDNNLQVKTGSAEQFYPNTNKIEIKASDANGLLLKDVKATVTIKRKTVLKSYTDYLQLPDTLLHKAIDLDNSAPTSFEIPHTIFGESDCSYDILITVITFENQRMEYTGYATYYYSHNNITQTVKNDSLLCFSFYKLGKVLPIDALLSYNQGKETKKIKLPYVEKLNQSLLDYTIQVPEYNFEKTFPVTQMYPELDLIGGIEKDSFIVALKNPLRLDISWYIYQGNMLLQKGSGKDMEFRHGNVATELLHYVEIFYTMGGEEQTYRETFAPETDYLSVDIDLPKRVYPGQKVDASVSVKNFWGKPVSGVDLTAFAVNSLLQYNVPDLPYYGSDPVRREQRAHYSMRKKAYSFNMQLDYRFWNKLAGLDQLEYYQFTYPWEKLFTYTVNTPDTTTQFAPYVMHDGKAINIYVIECDGVPVYFSWTEQPKGYSFPVSNKKHKISLRLSDRAVVLDSLQFKPGKKTILSLDMEHLPKGARIIALDKYWNSSFTQQETERYSKYISRIPVKNTLSPIVLNQVGNTYIIYDPCLISYRESILAGPIPQQLTRYNGGIEYKHEGGFSYQFDNNVVYKYSIQVCPHPLYFITDNNFNNFNDFCLTPQLYRKKTEECRIGIPWHPDNIFISQPDMTLNFRLPVEKDSSGVSNLLFEEVATGKILFPNVVNNNLQNYSRIPGGKYNIILLYNNGSYLKQDQIEFKTYTLLDINMSPLSFHPADSISANWLKLKSHPGIIGVKQDPKTFQFKAMRNTGNVVEGLVQDEKGEALIGASIMLKDTEFGVITDIDGYFKISVDNKHSVLTFNYLGYKTKELEVYPNTSVVVTLEEEQWALEEVVVVGYGTQKKATLTGAISSVNADRMSEYTPPPSPENLKTDDNNKKGNTEINEAEEQLYNELRLLNGLRSNFSDVGFWEPRLVTDKKGEAGFSVTFPDNITRWDAVVYAMNSKLKTGTGRKSVKSYKPIMAELKTPQFLVTGDSSYFAGNIRNYTNDSLISGNITFAREQNTLMQQDIKFAQSHQDKLSVAANTSSDSLTASYLFTRDDGYSDGEERTIPIISLGTEIAKGSLDFLRNEDTVSVKASNNETVHLDITGNQLDVFLDVTRYLTGYKYDCNEQLASKLIGLMEYRQYMKYKGEAFKHDKQVNTIIKRLMNNQNDKKLWSWWGKSSETSLWMSNHILRALMMAKKEGYTVGLDLRQTETDYADIQPYRSMNLQDVETIHILSEWGAKQDYSKALVLLENMVREYEAKEDSLARNRRNYIPYSYLKEKLLLLEIRQKYRIGYSPDSLKRYLKTDMLGQVYCDDGKTERYWYADKLAATLIGYRIVRNDSSLINLKEPMQMYILSTKRYDWNTYRASSVISTILPDLLAAKPSQEQLASIVLSGKENMEVTKLPYSTQLQPGESLSIVNKKGIPLIYSQYSIKRELQANSGEGFEITSSLDKKMLKAGEKTKLTVSVKVKQKGAEYVMIEIPIPASCSYTSKSGGNYYSREVHREYFKEKTDIFCENLPVGDYVFTIDLLPRFSGSYTLNPAKVELMYFPAVNANNDIRRIRVEE